MTSLIILIQPVAPLFVITIAIAIALAALATHRSFMLTNVIAAAGLIGAILSLNWANHAPVGSPMFVVDRLAIGFTGLILIVGLAVLMLGASYWSDATPEPREEFPLMLLIAILGATALAMASNFITLFLGLETMTLAMIGMIAYCRWRSESVEAGLKYLVLSGLSSAILLLGIGLIDVMTGHLTLATVMQAGNTPPLMLIALGLISVSVGFKLSLVPFHIWVPDVYAGAPAPGAAFLATIPKIAVVAVLARALFSHQHGPSALTLAITIAAVASMLAGNLLALLQQNLKRILGYSSIAQLGYILVALRAEGTLGHTALLFFIAMYAVTLVGAFGVIGALSDSSAARDADQITDITGLFWNNPFIASVLTLTFLSLAGIPPAFGFMAKLYVMAAGVHSHLRILIATMVVSSVIGLFYYLRVIIAMTQRPDTGSERAKITISRPTIAAIGLIGVIILVFGLVPQPLLVLLRSVFKA